MIAISMKRVQEEHGTAEESIRFAMSALKAMTVFCERKLAGDEEPVKYEDRKVDGFTMTIQTGGACMLLGVKVDTPALIRGAVAMLSQVRTEISEEKFFELLMVIQQATAPEKNKEPDIVFKKEKV